VEDFVTVAGADHECAVAEAHCGVNPSQQIDVAPRYPFRKGGLTSGASDSVVGNSQ
jgi:hypothetical protein